MARIYLALGSNMGEKQENILAALGLLEAHISNAIEAPLYVSKAMYHKEQDDFINTAIGADTDLAPDMLLAFIKDVEQRVGREARFRNGPREIDIDVLLYDDLVLDTPILTIPHKLIEERAFVLFPLADIVPDLVHPVLKLTIKELLAKLSESARAEVRPLLIQ